MGENRHLISMKRRLFFGMPDTFLFQYRPVLRIIYNNSGQQAAELQILPKQLFAFSRCVLSCWSICTVVKEVNTIYWVPTALSIVANWKVLDYVSLPYMERFFSPVGDAGKQLNYWRRKMPELLYANLYGPTEETDICAYYIVDRIFADSETFAYWACLCDNCDLIILREDGTESGTGRNRRTVRQRLFLSRRILWRSGQNGC